jgi:ABC-type multidrug transport system permease subunit
MSRSPLWQLYLTRIREFYRQPARIFWVYGFPLVIACVLSLAFRNNGPQPIYVEVVEGPGAAEVRDLVAKVEPARTEQGLGRVVVEIRPRELAEKRLLTGKVGLLIEPVSREELHYSFDPTRPEAVVARAAFDDAYQRALGRKDIASSRETRITEPGSRYIDWLIPGFIGMNAMGGGLWGIGFLLVNFRLGKLLKRFAATPMPRRDFLLALFGARLTFLAPDLIILLGLGAWGFGMPIRGSLTLVVLVDVVGSLAFAGIGMLIGSRVQTTEAASGLMNLVMMPMWLLSGVFFSSERFPSFLQPLIQALPLTQLVDALRRVILEGAGLIDVAGNLIIMGAWAIVTFLLALRIFKWS